jgi:hypothetical protein
MGKMVQKSLAARTRSIENSRPKRVFAELKNGTFALLERDRKNASKVARPKPQRELKLEF